MARIERDYYKILLVSSSGQGKTYSFRNLVAAKTGFINAENKPLPFSNQYVPASSGGTLARPTKWAGVVKAFDDFSKNPAIDIIVLDSISAAFDMLLEEARTNFNGWDVWNYYNKMVGEFVSKIKKAEKEVVITGHYELLNIEGAPEKRLKMKGKEWEGVFEKEFTIVLYPEIKYKGGKPDSYWFKLASEGSSAKCPPSIFGDGVFEVPNDFKVVYDKVLAFAMGSSTTTNVPSEAEIDQTIFN